MTPPAGSPVTTQTNSQGMYEFKGLPPGKYTLNVIAQGFTVYENDNATIADQPLRLNIQLVIAVEQEKIQVSDTAPTVDVNPANNAGAIVLSGKELEALPDDPDELQSDLEALAGPSAGPNGGQMYIDGFTAGQLPPKSSIREIRINQNPFSSEYDKLGYGRIEIFTKPGTDKFHGQFMLMEMILLSMPRILSRVRNQVTIRRSTAEASAARWVRRLPFSLISIGGISTILLPSTLSSSIPTTAAAPFPLPMPCPIRGRAPISARASTTRSARTTRLRRATSISATLRTTTESGSSTSRPGLRLGIHGTHFPDQRHPCLRRESRQRDALPVSS